MGRIICLVLLSSPVCLRGAVCLLGAACPPERLLQHNHFKPEPVLFIHTYTQTPAGRQVLACSSVTFQGTDLIETLRCHGVC